MSGDLKVPLSLSMEDVSSRQWQYRRVSGRHVPDRVHSTTSALYNITLGSLFTPFAMAL